VPHCRASSRRSSDPIAAASGSPTYSSGASSGCRTSTSIGAPERRAHRRGRLSDQAPSALTSLTASVTPSTSRRRRRDELRRHLPGVPPRADHERDSDPSEESRGGCGAVPVGVPLNFFDVEDVAGAARSAPKKCKTLHPYRDCSSPAASSGSSSSCESTGSSSCGGSPPLSAGLDSIAAAALSPGVGHGIGSPAAHAGG